GRIVPQQKSRECDGCSNGFEVRRRQGDDQAFDLPPPDPLENVSHGTNMPIEMKLFTRHHRLKRPADKGYELAPQQFVSDCTTDRRTQGSYFGHGAIGAISNAASLDVATRAR